MEAHQKLFAEKNYKEQRKALAQMIADDGCHSPNVFEIWNVFGEIILASEQAKIDQEIANGTAEVVSDKSKFNGFKSLGDKKIEPVVGPIFLKPKSRPRFLTTGSPRGKPRRREVE